MTVYQKLAIIEAKMATLEHSLGLPQRINLLLRHQTYNKITKVIDIVDTVLAPIPHIVPVPIKYINLQISIEGADSIFITTNDIQIEIPRTVSKTIFLPGGDTKVRYLIDPPLNVNNEPIYSPSNTTNIPDKYWYRLIFLDESDPTVWKLIVTRERDKK